ncbi:MAG: Hint domain-containing protein [Yoonia sp.]|uniref:Hint domain-containing protein n=1 Tax=Yoonia sp. TaxID=2212373 RepID=UPI003264DB3F
MKTGFRGTFVIPWAQTAIDGEMSPNVGAVKPGVGWVWTGNTTRVDGPSDVLLLDNPLGQADLRRRAGLKVQQMFGDALQSPTQTDDEELTIFGSYFSVTDGRDLWIVTVIGMGAGKKPLLMFQDTVPPQGTVLWVVKEEIKASVRHAPSQDAGGVICFTPGTAIMTPDGARDVSALMEGDYVQTQDNGKAEILWIGRRLISGARMRAQPHLRPIRLREGALDKDVPDAGLLVSPDHRIVLRGARARTLFNADEVLVSAKNLVNDSTIVRAHGLTHVTYIHMMLGQHEIVFANGVPTESFHPASAALGSLRKEEQSRLLTRVPEIRGNPMAYGGYARRKLSASDAAILQADARTPRRF